MTQQIPNSPPRCIHGSFSFNAHISIGYIFCWRHMELAQTLTRIQNPSKQFRRDSPAMYGSAYVILIVADGLCKALRKHHAVPTGNKTSHESYNTEVLIASTPSFTLDSKMNEHCFRYWLSYCDSIPGHVFNGPADLKLISTTHDDIIKLKHFPCYWPFVRGIHRSQVNSPHKGQ